MVSFNCSLMTLSNFSLCSAVKWFSQSPTIPETIKCDNRVKSGDFGHQVNSDSDLVCFIF